MIHLLSFLYYSWVIKPNLTNLLLCPHSYYSYHDMFRPSIEVGELVELVAKQAQRGRFEADHDVKRRWLVWHRFYVNSKEEVTLLHSLMVFKCYCRGVVFDIIDGRSLDRTASTLNGEDLSSLNPEDFRCPISLEIMMDPRWSIVKWLKAGNHTCPKTGEKLTSTEMIPNSALQKLIKQYCSNNGILLAELGNKNKDISRTMYAGSPAAAEAMKLLSDYLTYRLAVGTSEDKNKAANEIRLLAKASIFNRSCLLEAGSIPHLLHLLSANDASLQENSIAALLNLSKHLKSKEVIIKNGGVIFIVEVLTSGLKTESRQLAAAALFYLSSVEEYRKLIGEKEEAIDALVGLIKDGTPRGKKNAVVAIFGLVLLHENHQRVLKAGAVPLLVDLLTNSDRSDLVTESLAVLATIVESKEGTSAILYTPALSLVIGILHSSTSKTAREYCVSILLALSVYGGVDVVSKLQKSSSLVGSLHSLLTDGTSRASKKASTFLKILHEFHNTNSGLPASVRTQERYVK
ncbi:hypothetical protein ACHQM5_030523 [Ranunculus cassubicifolius]